MPSASDRAGVERLVAHYRQRQRAQLAALSRRFGEGPRLREYRLRLEYGELLDHHVESRLGDEARSDNEARRAQEQLRLAYLEQRREREARQRARAHGLVSYLLHGSTAAYTQVDEEWLRFCERCQEIAYPADYEQHGYGSRQAPRQCHFCASSALERSPHAPT